MKYQMNFEMNNKFCLIHLSVNFQCNIQISKHVHSSIELRSWIVFSVLCNIFLFCIVSVKTSIVTMLFAWNAYERDKKKGARENF